MILVKSLGHLVKWQNNHGVGRQGNLKRRGMVLRMTCIFTYSEAWTQAITEETPDKYQRKF